MSNYLKIKNILLFLSVLTVSVTPSLSAYAGKAAAISQMARILESEVGDSALLKVSSDLAMRQGLARFLGVQQNDRMFWAKNVRKNLNKLKASIFARLRSQTDLAGTRRLDEELAGVLGLQNELLLQRSATNQIVQSGSKDRFLFSGLLNRNGDGGRSTVPKGTMKFYTDIALARQQGAPARMVSPREDRLVSKEWWGADVPEALKGLIPENLRVIEHQLILPDDPAVIKNIGSKNMTIARLSVKMSGKNLKEVQTNVHFPMSYLAENMPRKDKWLAPEGTRAAVIWLHGGGTLTTGSHTAAGIMGHYEKHGFAVIGVDQPWHAGGPRESFTFADKADFIMSLIEQTVHESVPVIIAGHSYGGLDALQLRSAWESESLSRRFRARNIELVAISPVADALPGGTYPEKVAEANRRDHLQDPEMMAKVPADERNLGERLARAGKISPLASSYVDYQIMDYDLTDKPGVTYPRTLVLIGGGDELYLRYQDIFDHHISGLQNVELVVFGEREFFDGTKGTPGHLVFDHYLPGTQDPETFTLIRQFIEKREGISDKVVRSNLAKENGDILKVAQLYFNNLAFRVFIETFSTNVFKSTVKLREVTERLQSLNTFWRSVTTAVKGRIKDPGNNTKEVETLLREEEQNGRQFSRPVDATGKPMSFAEVAQEKKGLEEILHKKVAKTPEAQANIDRRAEIQSEIKNLEKQRDSLNREHGAMQDEKVKIEKQIQELINDKEGSAELTRLKKESESLFQSSMRLYDKIREESEGYFLDLHRSGTRTENSFLDLPQSVLKTYEEYMLYSRQYQAMAKRMEERKQSDILSGAFGREVQALGERVYGDNGIVVSMAELDQRVLALDGQVFQAFQEEARLQREYFEKHLPGYFTIETHTLASLLRLSPAEFLQNRGAVQQILGGFKGPWESRRRTEGSGLY